MDDFRHMALGLPLAVEQPHFGSPSFRVNGKIFAQLSADGATGLVKLPQPQQAWAVATYPEMCIVEPQWGRHGWTRLVLAEIPADLLRELLAQSWRSVTPRALHGRLA